MSHRSTWLLAYLAFVVYGSLVPLDYHPLPPGEAWQRFQQIPFLALGVGSRADWVANGVLYLPLGFLVMRALAGVAAPLAWALAVTLCAALATGVEFAQLFFPPRTVSQNDLLAEFIGSALGASLALVLAHRIVRLREAWAVGGRRLGHHLLEVYAALYVALCFFPYDLLLSRQEVADKLASPSWSTFLVLQDRGLAPGLLQLGVEIALVLPIGMGLAWHLRTPPLKAALYGLLLGGAIEIGQFFIASGISQGASVLSRGAGLALGAALAPALAAGGLAGTRAGLRRWSLPILCVYLPLLLFASSWFRGPWHGVDGAATIWAGLRLLPFYYHYYTTEAVALFSLGSVALMYLPPAALGWARGLRPGVTLALVLALALVVETGKLFIDGQHPDPTNPIIAVAAAALALWLAGLATRLPASGGAASAVVPLGDGSAHHSRDGSAWPLLLVLPAALAWAWAFPAISGLLLGLLAACAAAVWWRPAWALAIVPAAMPVLDLAPWSGRFFWTEFDLLLCVCLAVAAFRRPAPRRRGAGVLALSLAFALLGISLAISTLRALLPWPSIDDNSFSSYTSAFNALRIVKGAVWAWLFVLVWQRLAGDGEARVRNFSTGMVAGLAVTVAWVLWERITFVGLFDFTSDYRVTGPFSAMHKGGAYVECYLAAASAFALAAVFSARRWWARALSLALLAGAGYAVMVTYSRNGYAAYAAGLLLGLVLQLGAAAPWRRRLGSAATAFVVVMLVAAAALPVLGGSFARERLAQSARDLSVRQAHWADALQLRNDDAWTLAFGEGIGRFPQAHFWRSREPQRAASYALARDGEKRFLRLGPGARLYVEQIVPRRPRETWTLSVDLRSTQAAAAIGVSLCHKWLLTSVGCVNAAAGADGAPGAWRRAEVPLDTAALAPAAGPAGPLLKLALATPADGPVLDVARVSLRDGSGAELLANGDFRVGMDHWFFATDTDPPWHIHSLPVAVWFDQGAFGALAWALLVAVALVSALRGWRGAMGLRLAALPAAVAFLVSGALNTLIDEPRFLMLLLVCLWLAGSAASVARPAGAVVRRPPGAISPAP